GASSSSAAAGASSSSSAAAALVATNPASTLLGFGMGLGASLPATYNPARETTTAAWSSTRGPSRRSRAPTASWRSLTSATGTATGAPGWRRLQGGAPWRREGAER
ncbi:unnamed protein product, partial [Lampetra fluviatilis]